MTYDFLQLDRNSAVPLYRQLYLSIRSAVESGHLPQGARLPSVRRLAGDLSLSCTTVEGAYQQLCVEGYIRSAPQKGYFVLDAKRDGAPDRKTQPPVFHRAAAAPVRYNFGSDCVDMDSTDIRLWRRNVRNALNRQNALASYGDHQGESALREALSAYSYGARGVVAPPEQILIGAGTQPLLSILCGLISPGSSVVMEEPGFPQAEQIFSDHGISVLKLPCDGSGLRMDALEKSGARFAYVSPSNRVLTGSSIPMSRRMELLKWAEHTGGVLIEDDYNGELRYRARPIPAMQGIANGKDVVYLGSFSKLLLPSVRIGDMVLTPELLARYLPRAANYNQTASKVEQLALAEYIRSGQMERHLRRLRKLYGEKSEALIRALESAFGSRIEILLQETPLTLILTVHTERSAAELCRLAAENGVRVQLTAGGHMRLGFAGIPLADIGSAVLALRDAWAAVF